MPNNDLNPRAVVKWNSKKQPYTFDAEILCHAGQYTIQANCKTEEEAQLIADRFVKMIKEKITNIIINCIAHLQKAKP